MTYSVPCRHSLRLSQLLLNAQRQVRVQHAGYATGSSDPRLDDLGQIIEDKYAALRENYQAPKNPIVLAHGLLGFDELRLAGKYFPGVQYWRGIKDALEMKGVEVFPASVSPSASIERRAEALLEAIEAKAKGRSVNIIAGLDSRYMISCLKPTAFKVLSLSTIATPHRGSAFADYVFDQIGPNHLPNVYKVFDQLGIETGAFSQLTRKYMKEEFNPRVRDIEDVKYLSYGAMFEPTFWSVFKHSHSIIQSQEGPNDGMVSVTSSKWGGPDGYKGTLTGVSHLDLINWTNRWKWAVSEMMGYQRKFNAIAFYLDIADTLAQEGL